MNKGRKKDEEKKDEEIAEYKEVRLYGKSKEKVRK